MYKPEPIQHVIKNIFVLLLLVLCINWFFTFQIVSLKDDNSFYYMPVRMYLSDALHHGTLPFWNPFIMNGVPQYADMQGAVWNPIAFILCYVFKYNHTIFLFEYIIYIFIGALGMFKLLQLITKQFTYVLAGTTVYIACGFVSSVANFINWTASLAFLPWLFYFFFNLLKIPTIKQSILLGITCWLSLVCGYPAFIIYSTYILLVIFCWFVFQQFSNKTLNNIVATTKYLLLALIIGILLSLPAIIAYLEFLPFYARGENLTTSLPFRDCFYPQFLSSLFIPSSVYNKSYDVLCHSANRDLYFGVLPLIGVSLFIINFKTHKNALIIVLSSIAVFTFIFLFGYLTPLGNASFNFLPLMGSFKWSALPRFFLIMLFVLAMVFQLSNQTKSIQPKEFIIIRLLCASMLIGIVFVFYKHYTMNAFETTIHKNIFYINTIVQIVLWLTAFTFFKTIWQNKKFLIVFIIADLAINYSIGMAMTGVANVKPLVFNNYCTIFYKQDANKYLKQPLGQNASAYSFDPWTNHKASKILNGSNIVESNTVFTGYEKMFLQDTANGKILRNHAFAFSEDVDSLVINDAQIDYTSIQLNITANKAGHIILQQNNYYRWQELNGLPLSTWNNCFMQLPIKAGENKINLQYSKGNYEALMKLSYTFLILLIGILLFSSSNKILATQRKPS